MTDALTQSCFLIAGYSRRPQKHTLKLYIVSSNKKAHISMSFCCMQYLALSFQTLPSLLFLHYAAITQNNAIIIHCFS